MKKEKIMKVKELIERLKTFDQELDVVVLDEDGISFSLFEDYCVEKAELLSYGSHYRKKDRPYDKKYIDQMGEGKLTKVIVIG